MRVVDELIEHLRDAGLLTRGQLDSPHRKGLVRDDHSTWHGDPANETAADDARADVDDAWDAHGDGLLRAARRRTAGRRCGTGDSVSTLTRLMDGDKEFLDTTGVVAQRLNNGVQMGSDAALRVLSVSEAFCGMACGPGCGRV